MKTERENGTQGSKSPDDEKDDEKSSVGLLHDVRIDYMYTYR